MNYELGHQNLKWGHMIMAAPHFEVIYHLLAGTRYGQPVYKI